MVQKVKNLWTYYKIYFVLGVLVGTVASISFSPAVAKIIYAPVAGLNPNDITSSHISNGTIVNVDIGSQASIAFSKIDKNSLFVRPQTNYTGDLFKVSSGQTDRFRIESNGDVEIVGAASVSGKFTTLGSASFATLASVSPDGSVFYKINKKVQALAPGTSGQFLKTQGANSPPIWATAAPSVNKGSISFGWAVESWDVPTCGSRVIGKKIAMSSGGTISTEFRLAYGGGGGGNITGAVTRNGTEVGTVRQVNDGGSATTFRENISGWSQGDVIGLASCETVGAGSTVTLFRVQADIPMAASTTCNIVTSGGQCP